VATVPVATLLGTGLAFLMVVRRGWLGLSSGVDWSEAEAGLIWGSRLRDT
jgi:hypothetical protein